MTVFSAVVLAVYFGALLILALISCHRLHLLRLLSRAPRCGGRESNESGQPFVTVQLPVYNERFVIARTLDAIAELDYPRDCIELQVLDDSTDETTAIVSERLKELRARGWAVTHLRRAARSGFKAGALAAGLERARGELILILDADFLPPPQLLQQLRAPFSDAAVAMVQARWGHINREENRLTRVQALLLDAHFLIETQARAAAGLFFNFHGTAALWRRSAIEDAGGWQTDTLTEDLDLSYRAQLRGWRFVFLADVVVPGELPDTLRAFKQQQARWAEGTIATARKHLPTLLSAALPTRVKVEACVHLLSHTVYPAALLVVLLALPALLAQRTGALPLLRPLELALVVAVVLPNRIFFRRAARLSGTRPPAWRELPVLLLAGIALAVSNTRAVWRGLRRRSGRFERTPKTAGLCTTAADYRVRAATGLRFAESCVATYLLVAMVVAALAGSGGAVPIFAFLAAGFGATAVRG